MAIVKYGKGKITDVIEPEKVDDSWKKAKEKADEKADSKPEESKKES